ncbi:bactofilin family protein [Oceanibaculum pacificum]|nr:polymer-forming cytoskeletal protein [Oceanibaculum pacificum]
MDTRKPGTTTFNPDINRRPGGLAGGVPGSSTTYGMPASQASQEGSKLIVGKDIQLKGEITACDTLVVEGRVEASMDSRMIQVAESGLFSGEAGVDTAEIAGRFEGKLTARERLIVRSTGKVTGNVRYGRIEIEDGGEIAGDIMVLSAKDKPKLAEAPKPAVGSGGTSAGASASSAPSPSASASTGASTGSDSSAASPAKAVGGN